MPITRRQLLTTSIGAAAGITAVGSGLVVPALVAGSTRRPSGTGARSDTSIVAYVRAGSADELRLMVGNREVTVRDPELVGRLVAAAG